MSLANAIFWLLRDGEWHGVEEIMQISQSTQSKTFTVLVFLWKFGFVDMNEKEKQVKLLTPALKFVQKIGRAETCVHVS